MNQQTPRRPGRPGLGPPPGLRRALGTAALLLAAAAPGVPAHAAEEWAVRSGQVHLHLNVPLLHDLGIEVEVIGAASGHVEGLLIETPYWTFPIRPGSDLRFETAHGVVRPRGATAGAIRMEGALVLRERATGRVTRVDDPEIAPAPAAMTAPAGARGPVPLQLRSTGATSGCFELRDAMFDFRRRPGLQLHYMNACVTESWARAIGRPELAGWVVGVAEVRAEAERLSATPDQGPAYQPTFTGGVLDVSLGALEGIQQVARAGTYPNGSTAVSMATTSCNVGTVDVPWVGPMDTRHPVIHMALYRLLDGRFEQIGVSWLKHGFFALSNSLCTPCQNPSEGDFLGVGCSDTYGVSNNASRNELGPRGEVDPFAAAWECKGSHFSGGQPDCVRRHGTSGHGSLDHRLVVADADLANPGATYYYEANYVVEGDQDLGNNWGHRRCTMTWSGSFWEFSTPDPGNPLVPGAALAGWGDASDTVAVAPGDGEVLLAVKTTDLGSGSWRYEYALLNLNSDRQIRAFSLPVAGVANISAIGFHDNDAVGSNDWQVTLDADTIRWQTESFAQNPNAHALLFGYMYNFRFEADAPPASRQATLDIFKPGAGAAVAATTTGPSGGVTAVGGGALPVRMIDVRPNPFDRSATIWYQAATGGADLTIFDTSGRRVRTLVDAGQEAGIRSVAWDGRADDGARVRSGVYYVRLRSGALTAARSVVLVD